MVQYLVRQTLFSVIKLFVFITFMFFLVQIMMPGDYVDQFSLALDTSQREELRAQLGLDLPIGERYLHWLRQIVTLELGKSFGGQPIAEILKQTIPPTLLVFFTGTVIAFMLGLWLGKRTAWRGSGFPSRLTTLGGIILFTSFPPWIAFLLSYLFTRGADFVVMGEIGGLRGGLNFRGLTYEIWKDIQVEPNTIVLYMLLTLLLSAAFFTILNLLLGRLTRRRLGGFLALLLIAAGTVGLWFALDIQVLALDILKLSWLAVATYTLISFGETMLIMQSSMTEVLKEEYITTAEAKGLSAAVVREKHAARNALLPVLSRFVISLPYLVTGVVIIESSVGWPGMGTAMWNALYWQNMPVVMASLLIVGLLSLVARLILDVVIAYSDPRIRYGQQRPILQINPDNRAARARLTKLSGDAQTPEPTPPPPPTPTTQQAVQPSEKLPETKSARSRYSPEIWQRRSAAQAAASTSKIIYFPGTEAKPRVVYSGWERFKIRSGLSWRRFKMDWQVFSQSRLAVLGLILIVIFGIMALAHPILMKTVWNRAVYDPVTAFDLSVFPHPSMPGPGHLLGTDTLGRDVLSMLLAATTPAFIIGLTAALTTALVGTLLSVTAAYFGGAPDAIITNLADVFLLFPAPIIMIIIGARFRDLGPVPLGFIYGFVTGAGATVIVMRAHGLQVVSKPYMEAAQIAGGGSWHIITKHMLPAMLPLAALQMMIAVTGAVVADGFISFFGLTRTTSNWGTLIYNAFVYANIGASGGSTWHMLIPAALSFSLFALGFYLVSRGLHRVASPTIREERL